MCGKWMDMQICSMEGTLKKLLMTDTKSLTMHKNIVMTSLRYTGSHLISRYSILIKLCNETLTEISLLW